MADGVAPVLTHEQELQLRDDKYDHLNNQFSQLLQAFRTMEAQQQNSVPIPPPQPLPPIQPIPVPPPPIIIPPRPNLNLPQPPFFSGNPLELTTFIVNSPIPTWQF